MCSVLVRQGDRGPKQSHLAVNPNAVTEVTPVVRTEPDLQRVGQTRDKSKLERGKSRKRQDVILVDRLRHNILFRSASWNENDLPFWCKMFGSA